MLQLNPTIEVHTPLGDGEALFIIDYGINVNTVWVVRFPLGIIKHIYSDDIRVYGNPMNGSGWDVERLDYVVDKLPKNAKRKTDFLNKTNNNDTRSNEN
jgi:hypothetical protein